MPKYMICANYVGDGIKGVLKEGGSARRDAAARLIESMGGRMEGFYFAFGDTDAFVIADLPDNLSMSAIALCIGASGLVQARTTVLLTPEEVDQAARKSPVYRAPGQ